jgi:septal ring factor EnvC (AmiA/AmiB activator)
MSLPAEERLLVANKQLRRTERELALARKRIAELEEEIVNLKKPRKRSRRTPKPVAPPKVEVPTETPDGSS